MSFTTWIERTWVALGGPRCVDAAGLENVEALFRMLDAIEEEGSDLSPATIDSKISRLFAAADPDAAERAGIHVMTIHRAKGQGFNVVVVPGLERPTGNDRQSLICWLQRTCAAEPALGPRDEVLVAPIGQKGQKQDKLYRWVRIQRERREAEERKRLLYVACTRASEELHLLGTAAKSGTGVKPGSAKSLLATAWPALEPQFLNLVGGSEEVVATKGGVSSDRKLVLVKKPDPAAEDEASEALELAADASDEPLSAQLQGLRLRRLPLDLPAKPTLANVTAHVTLSVTQPDEDGAEPDERARFTRPEGSIEARALGITVHALFEKAARLIATGTPASELRAAISDPANRAWANHAASILRNNGVLAAQGSPRDPKSLQELTRRAVEAVFAAVNDPIGLWILGRHPGAQTETAWTGMLDGALRTLRVDRIFRAGNEPLTDGEDCLWIIDYKTAGRDFSGAINSIGEAQDFMRQERSRYEGQLLSYGRMLRLARGNSIEIRLGLYHPFMPHLEYWSM
jgi:ATP-dependent exoDNAse (exonuclease V) beta subunit